MNYLFPELEPQAVIKTYPGYEIVYLTPENNKYFGSKACGKHIVSLSGGLGSAFAAERAIQRYGRENVILWFADVLKENHDLYRFLHDLMKRWGGTLYWYTDGRRPEDVWDQKKIIPNSRIAPCTYVLKIEPFCAFITEMAELPKVYIGLKAHETDRQENTYKNYARNVPKAIVEYPLLWPRAETRKLEDLCEPELGIQLPLLYRLGYSYNNCNGECCRSGKECLIRTYKFFPDDFRKLEEWEKQARSHDDARKKYTIYARQVSVNGKKTKVPMTLTEIREEAEGNLDQLIPLCRIDVRKK